MSGNSMIDTVKFCLVFFLFWTTAQVVGQNPPAGIPILDSTGYVEYIPGNLPVVISVPHGGYLEPSTIPLRNCTNCVYGRDLYTQELGRSILASFYERTGCYPHVVINLLHRNRFDANRSITTAADGDPVVEQSWYAYHQFIESAKTQVEVEYGRGLFLDLHGHGHTVQRIELGYRLTKTQLQLPDVVLDSASYVDLSSIETLVGDNLHALTHSELLRGAESFGTLLADKGVPAVPSSQDPFPLSTESYFNGGYNTGRHGSKDGGNIDGIQVECHQTIRFDSLTREWFADSLVKTINQYIGIHYNSSYETNYCNSTTDLVDFEVNPTLIFPNPTKGYFNIKSEFQHLEVTIFNSLGQEVLHETWNGQPITIDPLKSGYYFIELRTKEAFLTIQKMVKL